MGWHVLETTVIYVLCMAGVSFGVCLGFWVDAICKLFR